MQKTFVCQKTAIIIADIDLIKQVILDIEEYPKFLPNCISTIKYEKEQQNNLNIIHKQDSFISDNIFFAKVVLGFLCISYSYNCKILILDNSSDSANIKKFKEIVKIQDTLADSTIIIIEMLSDGFKKFICYWELKNIAPNKVEVSFFIEFIFNNLFLQKVISKFFTMKINEIYNAFLNRVDFINLKKI